MTATSSELRVSRSRHLLALLALGLAVALLGASCTADDTPAADGGDDAPVLEAGPAITVPTVPLAFLDQQLQDRVDRAALDGALLIVEQDANRLHTFTTGIVTPTSPLPLAETGMWLTSATLMTLVDDGLVTLDEPVSKTLTLMDQGPQAGITLRQLLSQTSGLPSAVECDTPVNCDEAIATVGLLGPPGSVFALSPVGYHVAARLAEQLTGQPWATVVYERLLAPVGMGATGFLHPVDPAGNPAAVIPRGLLGADGATTADDLGRFLTMIVARGDTPNGRVLDSGSVEEMERDQTPSLDTSAEPWVAATGIPTYGLGVWRDRLRGDGTRLASMISAPNRFGVYPLVDRTRNAWALVAVDDESLVPFQAVRDSAKIAQLMAAAIDTDGRPVRAAGSTIPR